MNNGDFFGRKAQEVAKDLVGRIIIRKLDSGVYAALISEAGAYEGLVGADPQGPRKGMFYNSGNIFLMPHRGHNLFNIACGDSGPACVEIRELQGEKRIEGSGAITNYLKIGTLDNKPLGDKTGLYVSDESYFSGKINRSGGSADNCKGIYSFA